MERRLYKPKILRNFAPKLGYVCNGNENDKKNIDCRVIAH